MRTHEEAMAAATDGTPFSNSTQWELWADRHCFGCKVDTDESCPLVLVALSGKTPAEWTAPTEQQRLQSDYDCAEFIPAVDEKPAPAPPRPPAPAKPLPGQLDLFAEAVARA
jgi:hypothetical protein